MRRAGFAAWRRLTHNDGVSVEGASGSVRGWGVYKPTRLCIATRVIEYPVSLAGNITHVA